MNRPSIYSLRAFKLALVASRLLPRRVAQTAAPAIGKALYARRAETRRALQSNLRSVSGASGEKLDALCRDNVSNFSRMLADYFLCLATMGRCAKSMLAEWEGLEHLDAALAQKRGAVLVTGHLGNWELGGVLLAIRGFAMTVITAEEPTSELTRWRDAYRRRLGIKTIAVGPGHDFAIVEMIQALRRNEIVAMLVDRPYAGSGQEVEFFGRTAEFSIAPALLWHHTGAPIVPAFVLHNGGGSYTSFAQRPLDFERGETLRSTLTRNTQFLATHFESIVREHPDQWFNYVPIWKDHANS